MDNVDVEEIIISILKKNRKNNNLKSNTQNVNIHHKYTVILDDHGLTQIITEPTRRTKTLDMFITNYPGSFRRT